jgi:hypothetical protein
MTAIAEKFFNMYRFIMTVPVRLVLKLLGFFLAALVLIYIALFFVVQSSQFRDWAQAELSRGSGLEVHLTDLTLQPPLRVVVGALEVSKPGEFALKSSRLIMTLAPSDLWTQTLYGLTAEGPVLEVNIDEMMKPSTGSSAKFGLRHLNVRDGSIVLKKGGATVFELPNINMEAENLNLGQQSGINLRADVPPLKGEAELHLSGQLRALEADLIIRPQTGLFRRRDSGNAEPELMRLRAKLEAPENQRTEVTIDGQFRNLVAGERLFSGNLNARAAIDDQWTEAILTGRAVLRNFRDSLGAGAAKLPAGDAAADFAGSYSLSKKLLTLKAIEIHSSLGKGSGQGAAIFDTEPRIGKAQFSFSDIPLEGLRPALPSPLNQWTIQGRGQIELDLSGPFRAPEAKGIARAEGAKLGSRDMSLANLNFTVPFEWSNSATRIREAKLLATQLAYGGKDRWQGAAERVQISASTEFPSTDSLKITGFLETAGGKFSSPDNSRIGENLMVMGRFDLNLNRAKNSTALTGRFGAESGEILWGEFFTDLKTPKPAFEIDADYLSAEDRLDCRRCSVKLLNVGEVDTVGSVERVTQSPVLRLRARSTNFLPGGFFETFLQANLNRQYPVLDKLAVGGKLAFQTQLRGGLENLSAGGELSLEAGELRSRSNDWEVGPIALNLPFLISWADANNTAREPARTGTFTIEKMRFGKTTVGRTSATLSLFNNELRFHQALRATIFDGELIVGNLLWPNVIGHPKQLSFSLDTKRLQLQEMTRALGWPSFSGTLTGSIPEVQSSDTTLRTKGEIQAELFGGRVRMSRLEIENPFSTLAAIRLDANLTNIELEQLSKTFAFGRISGILEGTVGDLIITDGQPAQFGADLHSVDRGGEQRISVEALNKITVLSSGQSAGALYGGLAGFFDSFRYSKLGFKAILRNDRLTLRGVETRGNEEYLVVGSFLPPTVNIVSHTQTIAFSELVRRLERIRSDKPEVKY